MILYYIVLLLYYMILYCMLHNTHMNIKWFKMELTHIIQSFEIRLQDPMLFRDAIFKIEPLCGRLWCAALGLVCDDIYIYVCIYVCMYIYMYMYIYMCMYIYIYMYTCYKFTLGKYIDGHIYLIYWCWLVVFMFHIYIGWFDVFLVSLNVEDPCLFVWRWTFWPKNICARAGEHRTTTWFNSNHIFYPECFFTPSQTCLSTYRITYVQYIHHEAISQPRCIFQTKVANKTSCQPRINVNPWAFQFGG